MLVTRCEFMCFFDRSQHLMSTGTDLYDVSTVLNPAVEIICVWECISSRLNEGVNVSLLWDCTHPVSNITVGIQSICTPSKSQTGTL